jgi:hypothetical protein
MPGGTRQSTWLRYFATSQKVAGSSPDKVHIFNLLNSSSRIMALGSTSASNRTEYQLFSLGGGGKWWPARKADNLTAICEMIV